MESTNETSSSRIGTLSRSEYLATGIYVMTVGLLGTFGNITVITVVLKFWSRKNLTRKPHLPLILGLAISDLCISFFGYPYSSLSGFAGRWLFNDSVCKMVGFCCFFLSMSSMDILVAISVYRYISICRPALKAQLSLRTSGAVIAACCAYAILWAAPPLFGLSEYTLEPFGTSCSMNWASRKHIDIAFLIGTDIFCFLLHLVALIICYYKIYARYQLLGHRHGKSAGPILNQEIRVTLVSLVLVVVFFIVWFPYAIVCTWEVFGGHLTPGASALPTMFAKSSCAFNPILYGACDKHFRQIAKRLLCPCKYNAVGFTSTRNRYISRRPISLDIFASHTGDNNDLRPQLHDGAENAEQSSERIGSGNAPRLAPRPTDGCGDVNKRTADTFPENIYKISPSLINTVDSNPFAQYSVQTSPTKLKGQSRGIEPSFVALQWQPHHSQQTCTVENPLRKSSLSVKKTPKPRPALTKRSTSLYSFFSFSKQDNHSADKSIRYSLEAEGTAIWDSQDAVMESRLKNRPDGENFSDVLASNNSNDSGESFSQLCNLEAPVNHRFSTKASSPKLDNDVISDFDASCLTNAVKPSLQVKPLLKNTLPNLTVTFSLDKVKIRSHNLYLT